MDKGLQISLFLIWNRLRSSWGALLVVSLGTLTAVVMLSAVALYSDVLAEAGVRYGLFSRSQTSLNIQILVQNRPLGPEDYAELRSVAEENVRQRVSFLATDLERYGRTQAGMPSTTNPESQPPPLGSPSGRLFFMTGFMEHSRLLDGSWPQNSGQSGPDGVELEAVVGDQVADDMGYLVGTRVYVTPFPNTPEERIVLNIVGIASPVDPRDEFWLGAPVHFGVQTVGEELVIPMFVTENDFLHVLGSRFPIAVGDFGFNVFVDPAVIAAGTVDSTLDALEGLETDLNKVYPRTLVLSRLGLTLEEFKRDLTLALVPVYVFVSLVVVVVLYFLAVVSGILAHSQAREIGLLRSRGASILQVCVIFLTTEGIMALFAVALGPVLALAIVRLLILPTFDGIGGGPIEVSLSGEMYWMGAIGAVLSILVLAVSVAGRARTGVADSLSSRSRPPVVSFVHRYYLDLVFLLLLGLVWWQFQQRDGFVSNSIASNGLDVDPMVALGPVLGLLAAALLVMRILPILVRLVLWLSMRSGPGWASLAFLRVARDPVLPASLAVLLMLVAALGVFGATIQSSLTRSQSDQASYNVGGEVRISGPGVDAKLEEQVRQVEGVEAATLVLRDSVSLIEGHSSSSALLIAADPEALAKSSWFRADFAATPFPELAKLIATGGGVDGKSDFAVPLPPLTHRLGVWLQLGELLESEPQGDINIWSRIVDSEGRYRNVSMGRISGADYDKAADWSFFAGDVPEALVTPEREWSLAAIIFTTSAYTKVAISQIRMDDFTAFASGLPNDGVVVENFEEPRQWLPVGTTARVPDTLDAGPSGARTGNGGITFTWSDPAGGEQRGIHLSPVPLPIPAIGGAGLFQGDRVRIRQGLGSVPVEVRETIDLFPTVSNFRRPFLLLDLSAYQSYLKVVLPGSSTTRAKELWLSLDPSHTRDTVIADITSQLPPLTGIQDREKQAEVASLNPLAGGGWDGLSILSMAGVGLAVVAAMLVYGAASIHAARVDSVVARALGVSRKQVYLSLVSERWLMGGLAIAAGAAIGYWPGIELVQLLDLSASSAPPLPEMIPTVHLALLATVLAALAASVTVSAVFEAVMANRLSPVDVLREEV